jgi:hypothetical protein
MRAMTPKTRPISWIKAALKEFEAFSGRSEVNLSGSFDDCCIGRQG